MLACGRAVRLEGDAGVSWPGVPGASMASGARSAENNSLGSSSSNWNAGRFRHWRSSAALGLLPCLGCVFGGWWAGMKWLGLNGGPPAKFCAPAPGLSPDEGGQLMPYSRLWAPNAPAGAPDRCENSGLSQTCAPFINPSGAVGGGGGAIGEDGRGDLRRSSPPLSGPAGTRTERWAQPVAGMPVHFGKTQQARQGRLGSP